MLLQPFQIILDLAVVSGENRQLVLMLWSLESLLPGLWFRQASGH